MKFLELFAGSRKKNYTTDRWEKGRAKERENENVSATIKASILLFYQHVMEMCLANLVVEWSESDCSCRFSAPTATNQWNGGEEERE